MTIFFPLTCLCHADWKNSLHMTFVSTRLKKDTITILSLCISTSQHPSPSSVQMFVSHEPSLLAFALMSLLGLSGRAPGLVTRRLWVWLLLGTLRFLSDELSVWLTEKIFYSLTISLHVDVHMTPTCKSASILSKLLSNVLSTASPCLEQKQKG